MKSAISFRHLLASALVCSALLCVPTSFASTLFFDDFDGDGSDLNGATPDVTTGPDWVASEVFNRNGTTDDNAGSATLAFTPVNGFVYTLDATYSGLGLATAQADTDWFAVGFVNGQSPSTNSNSRFITGNVVGAAWMFTRGDTSLTSNNTFLGTGQLGNGNFGLGVGGGDNTGAAWSLSPAADTVDMRVVLDTTGGTGNWTATWFAKHPADTSYTEVRAATNLLPGATISAVGLARSNPGVTGTVESFRLSAVVPEPATLVLLGMGGLCVLLRHRWG